MDIIDYAMARKAAGGGGAGEAPEQVIIMC